VAAIALSDNSFAYSTAPEPEEPVFELVVPVGVSASVRRNGFDGASRS